MKFFCKKALSVLLCVIVLIPTFSAYAYTVNDVVNEAVEIILSNEGVYDTVLANDNGALSIGKVGWHGTRALNLLKTIINANKTNGKKIVGDKLYNEILSESNWNNRKLTSDEKAVIQKLLATDESKKAQDELAFSDIKDYVIHGQALGLTDGKVLVYFADLENQMGANGAERVAMSAIKSAGSASKVTLKHIYNAAMSDVTAQSSPTRRKKVYDYCSNLSFTDETLSSFYQKGRYKITAEPTIRVRSGPGTSYSKVAFIPTNTIVSVTEVSGDWGKVVYNGVTGWISLLYTEKVLSSSAPSAITPTKMGDINGNGAIDASDARLILRYSARLENFSDSQKKYADVNKDGKISSSDARIVLRVSAKLETI